MDAVARELHALLEEGLSGLGVSPSPVERWVGLALLLDRWGRRLNLTGHPDARSVAERLLLEAAALERALPPAERIADLGSGAGIPGIPLALCRPDARIWLVESRERRHHFQRTVIRELGLDNVEALRGRAEDLEPRACDGVVSQAFARPDQALAWMVPWVASSGWVALATVPGVAALSHPELGPGQLYPYSAPRGPARAVWLARRSAPPGP